MSLLSQLLKDDKVRVKIEKHVSQLRNLGLETALIQLSGKNSRHIVGGTELCAMRGQRDAGYRDAIEDIFGLLTNSGSPVETIIEQMHRRAEEKVEKDWDGFK